MKKLFLAATFLLSTSLLYAQKLNRVIFTKEGQLESFEMELPENVILKISKDGQIINWGANRYAGHDEILREQLDPYVGRIEYYNQGVNEAFRGKIRSIGTVTITYYASFDNPANVGKIASIGREQFTYYTLQENEAFRGNIRSIGNNTIEWYSTFDMDDFRGKLKSVGGTAITYYTMLDDKFIGGKVKRIGNSNYTYYTSFDQRELRGFLKNGQPFRVINGLRFLVRN